MRAGIIACLCLWASLTAAAVRIERGAEERVDVFIDDELFTSYRTGERRPYFFPVLGAAGSHQTRQWPVAPKEGLAESRDHPHHTGLWFAHGRVLGAGDEPLDYWHKQRIRHSRFDDFAANARRGRLVARSEWLDRRGRVIADDRREMAFGAAGSRRWIDFTIHIRSRVGQGLVLGDTKEGTFAIRIPEELTLSAHDPKRRAQSTGSIILASGERDAAAWGKRSPWCVCHGELEGRAALIAFFDHPGNPRHPTWWMVRPYGLFAANATGRSFFEKAAPGTGDLPVPADGGLSFRYRLVFADRAYSRDLVAGWYQDFISHDEPPEK